jgi:flagellar hook-basal body complex protein FliE
MNEIRLRDLADALMGSSIQPQPKAEEPKTSFGDMLQHTLNEVNQQKIEADRAITDLVTGKQPDIHQTMIEVEKASISFELLMQVRNKVIAAYEKIMSTAV